MTDRKRLIIIANMSHLFFVTPLWYILVYLMLEWIYADRLMWFLFWAYLPVSLFGRIIYAIADAKDTR